MCGRFALVNPSPTFGPADISALQTIPPQYNISPGQSIHILAQNSNQKIRLLSKLWGIKLNFKKSSTEKLVINARSETANQKPMFAKLYTDKRCIILATGFYEWDKQHNPYYFFNTNSTVLGLAGIYNKEIVMLTKAATKSLQTIHHRMPVLLDPSDTELWLSNETPLEQVSMLLNKYQQPIQYHPVSTLVNYPINNTPECIESISNQLFT